MSSSGGRLHAKRIVRRHAWSVDVKTIQRKYSVFEGQFPTDCAVTLQISSVPAVHGSKPLATLTKLARLEQDASGFISVFLQGGPFKITPDLVPFTARGHGLSSMAPKVSLSISIDFIGLDACPDFRHWLDLIPTTAVPSSTYHASDTVNTAKRKHAQYLTLRREQDPPSGSAGVACRLRFQWTEDGCDRRQPPSSILTVYRLSGTPCRTYQGAVCVFCKPRLSFDAPFCLRPVRGGSDLCSLQNHLQQNHGEWHYSFEIVRPSIGPPILTVRGAWAHTQAKAVHGAKPLPNPAQEARSQNQHRVDDGVILRSSPPLPQSPRTDLPTPISSTPSRPRTATPLRSQSFSEFAEPLPKDPGGPNVVPNVGGGGLVHIKTRRLLIPDEITENDSQDDDMEWRRAWIRQELEADETMRPSKKSFSILLSEHLQKEDLQADCFLGDSLKRFASQAAPRLNDPVIFHEMEDRMFLYKAWGCISGRDISDVIDILQSSTAPMIPWIPPTVQSGGGECPLCGKDPEGRADKALCRRPDCRAPVWHRACARVSSGANMRRWYCPNCRKDDLMPIVLD